MLNGTQPKDHTEEAIEEFLEDNPRAHELAEMIAALEIRRETFKRELKAAPHDAGKKEWAAKLREVDKQIKVLKEEQAITGFVENTIRVTINRARIDELLEGSD
jgi:hypothetical protein